MGVAEVLAIGDGAALQVFEKSNKNTDQQDRKMHSEGCGLSHRDHRTHHATPPENCMHSA
uniref:Uncharacterized protein n=1 Tax=Magallana gigas TaxID=29159 RepID=K1QZU6_MAGGI